MSKKEIHGRELERWLFHNGLRKAQTCYKGTAKKIADLEAGGDAAKNAFKKGMYDQDGLGTSHAMDSLRDCSWEMKNDWTNEFYWMLGRQQFLSFIGNEKYLATPSCTPNSLDFVNCFYSSDKRITRYVMTKFAMYTQARLFDAYSIKSSDDIPDGISVVFGPACINRVLKPCIKENRSFIYIDHAYFNRGYSKSGTPMSLRIIPNGVHASGITRDVPAKRFNEMRIKVKRWRRKGSHVVVCPPTGAMLDVLGIKNTWLTDTVKSLRKYTDRNIIIRPKPGTDRNKADYIWCTQNYKNVSISLDVSLEDGLKNAWAIVAPVSGASIEAICMGIPSFTSENSPAAPVSSTKLKNIESPYMTDRMPFLYSLAYHQFNMLEIESGFAWNVLKHKIFPSIEILSENDDKLFKEFSTRHVKREDKDKKDRSK